jgi:hypothetical protein
MLVEAKEDENSHVGEIGEGESDVHCRNQREE